MQYSQLANKLRGKLKEFSGYVPLVWTKVAVGSSGRRYTASSNRNR